MTKLAILRPGALGDIICIFHISEQIYARYGHFDLFVFESYYEQLKSFVACNNFHFTLKPQQSLDRSKYEIVHSLIGYSVDKGYPKVELDKHLTLLMAEELGITDLSKPPKLELISPAPPENIKDSDFVTIQVKTGWSKYKELSIEQNEDICKIIKSEYPFKVVQIGGAHEYVLNNADYHVLGQPIIDSIGAVAWAKFHVGPDSVFNHISNFSWKHKGKQTTALIYFGSTSPKGSGYDSNKNLFLNLHCQPCYRENPEISAASGGPCPYNGMCLKIIPKDFLHSYLQKTFKNI